MDPQEISLLQQIDRLLQHSDISKHLNTIADRVEQNFQNSEEALAWEDVPLEIYGYQLPPAIQSSWIFLLRANSNSGAERHPNSHQRVAAWRGTADFQIWIDGQWQTNLLNPDFSGSIQERWASIPENTWHRAVVGGGNHWIVVSFHTAKTHELIEERPNSTDAHKFDRRVYKSTSL